jgi:exosortase/archaeosortase family protein
VARDRAAATDVAMYGVRATLLSAIGLGFLATPVAQNWLTEPLVRLLAILAEWIVRMGAGSIIREGNVLINPETKAAVHVTQACDGMSVTLVFLAILLAAKPSLSMVLKVGSQIVFAVQLFNIVRIVALFHLRSGPASIYDAAHVYIIPYATVLLGLSMLAGVIIKALSSEHQVGLQQQ